MDTLNLIEAAHFLRMHAEELRRRTKLGQIPGAKVGKCWVYIRQDLAEYVRSLYPQPRQALQVTQKKDELCRSINAVVRGGSASPHLQESELDALLKQKSKLKRRSCTTS
ncbi:helix-turn-helix domain-containing protein [Glaciimonas sp. CA11.2]|uniref:helix-turn-helix domain-containing protein n=1 Tax=Glaciimonas sp. CA11.2 TaxID=3048601 RepID=UPI003A10146E